MIRRIATLAVIAAAVAWTYQPAIGFAFLNWDDHAVILQNPSLAFPGVVSWAFTTMYMQHYQPLSWLVWAAIKNAFGLDASAFHLVNVVAHAACVLLVWAVGRRVLERARPEMPVRWRDAAAVAAALLFGVHPLRVEVVSWISALPYSLALAFTLASLLAYLKVATDRPERRPLGALALYAASLIARPVALGFPLVLLVVDTWLFKRSVRASVANAWPFAALAAGAAAVESVARVPGLNDTTWIDRLQSAATAPFVYLWHTLAPVDLTPLDVLPLDPEARLGALFAALLGLAGVSLAAWMGRHRRPALSAAWAAYLALLAPAAGLVPSGLQATADRYTYLPSVVVAIFVAGVGAWWAESRGGRARLVAAAGLILVVALSLASRKALAPWTDSISLWTRVVSLEPANDVGLYNLGAALGAEGRNDEAAARYREVLALQPTHTDARANLDRLDAVRLETEGNELAAQGDLTAAADRYGQAIALDPQRTHSHAGRGMALASLGRNGEAMPALREAIRQGADDPSVPNALGVLLLQSEQTREARAVFEAGLAIHQDDVGLARNLARLLATGPGMERRDAVLALQLATAVVNATGERDPRALETLAAALAANNRMAEAAAMNARAAALAQAQGDRDLAVQITARGRDYRAPGQQ